MAFISVLFVCRKGIQRSAYRGQRVRKANWVTPAEMAIREQLEKRAILERPVVREFLVRLVQKAEMDPKETEETLAWQVRAVR
jgi:hypothetical protein